MVSRAQILVVLPLLLSTACATTTPSVSPERRADIRAAADACLVEHPSVLRYDLDRFGGLEAWYKPNQGKTGTAATEPFFDCVHTRLAATPPPATTGAPTPTTAAASPVKVSALAVDAGERWPTSLPLPDGWNMAIRPPPPYVVDELLPFSGRFVGQVDGGRMAAGLIVEELRPPVARVIVSLFSNELGHSWRREADLEPETLTLAVERLDWPMSVRYQLQPDGTLFMRLDDGAGHITTMTLRRVP